MAFAQGIVWAMELWLILGALVAAVFLTVGIDRIDEDARGAYIFRPLLIPGVLLIWPLVLWRWWRMETERAAWGERYRPVRSGHAVAAVLMSLGIIAIVIAGLSVRQDWPAGAAPVQLSAGAGQ